MGCSNTKKQTDVLADTNGHLRVRTRIAQTLTDPSQQPKSVEPTNDSQIPHQSFSDYRTALNDGFVESLNREQPESKSSSKPKIIKAVSFRTKYSNEIVLFQALFRRYIDYTRWERLSKIILFQSLFRRYVDYTRCLRLYSGIVSIQSAFRSYIGRKKYIQYKLNVIKVQSRCRMFLKRKRYERLRRAKMVANEILRTEEIYVKKLRLIERLYLDPLTKKPDYYSITEQDVRAIFNPISLKIIADFHGGVFLVKLIHKIDQSWNAWQTVGDAFCDLAGFLKIYTEYVNNFDNSLQTIQKCKKINKFVTFLETNAKNPESNGIELDGLLIEPIQRIPRYELLLKELLKFTDPNHPDFLMLRKALSLITGIASVINERKRQSDSKLEVWRVARLIKPMMEDLISPTRRFIFEGPLRSVRTKENCVNQEYYFLFNDILLRTKPNSLMILSNERSFAYKQVIPLNQVQVKDPNHPESFQILFQDQTLSLSAKNVQQKELWIKHLNSALKEMQTETLNRSRSISLSQSRDLD